MIQVAQHQGFEVYTIASPAGKLTASFIPEKGGVGSSLKLKLPQGEKELLFLHDFFWDKALPDLPGGWPFLFPICARLERGGKSGCYLYDGKQYELPIHGFSWWLPWEVLDIGKENQLTLLLEDNEKTHAIYPFSFEVKLTYIVENDRLICKQTYTNKGDHPMPYYAGFHPYFLTPETILGKSDVVLDYSPIRRFVYNDQLTDLAGEKSIFETPVSITNPEINEQLTTLGDDKNVSLTYPDGTELSLNADGCDDPDLFSYLQLYTIPEKPFFCIEPWMSFPNALNTVQGVRWLEPLTSERGILTLAIKQGSE